MIGLTLKHFQIIDELGKGGMGEVWRANDTKLDREVAVKLLPEAVSEDAERLARFEREAKMLAALNHPNIAAIFGIEEADGRQLLILELVEGEELGAHIDRGAMPVDEALDVAHQIAEGLEAAHQEGIVHRDLKPANVKLTPGSRVKVLDFGLAKAFEPTADQLDLTRSPTLTAHMTAAGVVLGTAAYMSPEQARGVEVTELFSWVRPPGYRPPYDVTNDGQRFLINRAVNANRAEPLAVVLNWDAELAEDSR